MSPSVSRRSWLRCSDVLAALRNRFATKGVLRSIGVLMMGTVGAHVITVVAMPITTRLYAPEDFSILAVYSSILAILITLATMSLHIGVPLAESENKALGLLMLSGIVLLAVCGIVALVIWLAYDMILNWLGRPDLAPYLWLVVPGLFLAGIYIAVQMWFSRQQEFPLIARTRITRSVGASGTQLSLGAAGFGPIGLVLGHMLYQGLGSLLLLRRLLQKQKAALRSLTRQDLASALTENRNYVFLTTPENLMNMAAIQLPVIAIAATPAAGEAGHLYMTLQILALPMMLIGSSVAQVFLSQAGERYRRGGLYPFVIKILRGLLLTGGTTLAVVGLLGPFLAVPILGADWQETGNLIAWMTPGVIMQLLASPISTIFYVVQKQALAMWIQSFGLVIRLGAVLAAISLHPEFAMETYAVASFLAYTLTLALALRTARRLK